MVEVNRGLYLQGIKKGVGFAKVKEVIHSAVESIKAYMASQIL